MPEQDFSPPHGFTVNNAFTSTVYRDVYPAVDPKRAELSQAGKVILVTGASRGIGQAIATTLAQASAHAVIITARSLSSLSTTERNIQHANPSTEVLKIALDLTSESSVLAAFKQILDRYPRVDTLVNNAGAFTSYGQPIASADLTKWWNDFETNVKGTMLVTRSFLSHLATAPAQDSSDNAKPTVLTISSGAAYNVVPTISAYSLTKLTNLHFAAYLAAERPDVHSVAILPGIVATEMVDDSEIFTPYAHDRAALAGAGVNWAAAPEAAFMGGRVFNVNWDVEELKARKQEIVEGAYLTLWVDGLKKGSVSVLKE